jgi:hypothetical protein
MSKGNSEFKEMIMREYMKSELKLLKLVADILVRFNKCLDFTTTSKCLDYLLGEVNPMLNEITVMINVLEEVVGSGE